MKKNIVFFDMNPAITDIPIFQIGLCYIVGICHQKGYDFQIIEYDTLAAVGIESFKSILDKAECIGISIRNIDNTEGSNPKSYLSMISKYMRYLSEHYYKKIVLGGSGFSIMPEKVLSLYNLKYGIAGRGGYIWSSFLNWLNSGNTIESFFDSEIHKCQVEEDIYKYERLEFIWLVYSNLFNENKSLGFDTHIGCGQHCIYCTYPVITKGVDFRRKPQEITEFIMVANQKKVRQLQIVDDIFNSDLQYAKAVCRAIIKANNKIPIKCYLSPNIDMEFAILLKRAGVTEVVMGVDSLCDIVMKRMGKGFLENEVYIARNILKRLKIITVYTFILGGPFETEDTLNETKKNVLKHRPDRVTIQYGIRIYPNTPLFAMYSSSEMDYCSPQYIKSIYVTENTIQNVTKEIYSNIAIRKML